MLQMDTFDLHMPILQIGKTHPFGLYMICYKSDTNLIQLLLVTHVVTHALRLCYGVHTSL